jgi:hypothetical protein
LEELNWSLQPLDTRIFSPNTNNDFTTGVSGPTNTKVSGPIITCSLYGGLMHVK